MLEAQGHTHSLFSTFTYETTPRDGSLRKAELAKALKRLVSSAQRAGGQKVRYFACGEYGENFNRPHYHAAIFGLQPEHTQLIDAAWQHGPEDRDEHGTPGFTYHGVLTADSAAYIAGYVTKKLSDAPAHREHQLEREFTLMSKGIGLGSIAALYEALNTAAGAAYIARHGDVPTAFMTGGRMLPLGTYIRQRLRLLLFGDHKQPVATGQIRSIATHKHNQSFNENIQAYLPPLRTDSSLDQKLEAWAQAQNDAYQVHTASLRQKARKVTARHTINKSRKKL